MNFFSNNANEIITKNKQSVLNYIDRGKDFEGTAYKKTYERSFDQLVMNFLRDEVVSHFNFTPEEIEIIMDEDFIKIITEDKFFNIENYVTEDK